MFPQGCSKLSSKLHQYFQNLDNNDPTFRQSTWAYTQSNHPQPIKCVEPLKNGTICLADGNGGIFTGLPHQLRQIHAASKENTRSSHLAADSHCQLLASCSNLSTVNLLQLPFSDAKVKQLRFAEPINCTTFYSDELNGYSALIAGGLSKLWMMDIEIGKVFQSFGDWRLKCKKVVGLVKIGNGCLLMSQHVDRSVEVWDLRLPNRPVHIVRPLLDSAGPITSTSHVDTGGKLLARAGMSGKIEVEELLTGKLLANIQLHDKIKAVRFSSDVQEGAGGCYLAVAGLDRQYVCEIKNVGHRVETIGNIEKTTKLRWIADKGDIVFISHGNCINSFELVYKNDEQKVHS